MRVSKCHPQLGWLRLEARDYSRTMDRLLLERDKLADITWTGPAPAYLEWVAEGSQSIGKLAMDIILRFDNNHLLIIN